jgi:hypothetical protein
MGGMIGLLKVLMGHLTGARHPRPRVRQSVSAAEPRPPLASAMTREA